MDFKSEYSIEVTRIDAGLRGILATAAEYHPTILKAMEYSLFSGGKRLRPILFMAAYQNLFAGDPQEGLPMACGIEMIHTYSLIHDDLPAMDDDDYRRGMPANHMVFGQGVAILAGDALLNMAYEIMFKSAMMYPDRLMEHIRAINMIAAAAGAGGMIGGQAADLEAEGCPPNEDLLNYIHAHKTSALIEASLAAAAVLGGADAKGLSSITAYGRAIGMAVQAVDDILDATGDMGKLGKEPGSDLDNNKMTFTVVYGVEETKAMVGKLLEHAVSELDFFKEKGEFLRQIACFIADRRG